MNKITQKGGVGEVTGNVVTTKENGALGRRLKPASGPSNLRTEGEHGRLEQSDDGNVSVHAMPVHDQGMGGTASGSVAGAQKVRVRKQALSPEREAILEAIRCSGCALTPMEVFEQGAAKSHQVAKALLSLMVRQGQLSVVRRGFNDLPGRKQVQVDGDPSANSHSI